MAGLDFDKSITGDQPSQSFSDDISINFATKDLVQNPTAFKCSLTGISDSSSKGPQRLSCDIWLDSQHYMSVSLPPQDIIPYLGRGADTFAGKLFWSVMEHYKGGCKRQHGEITSVIQQGLRHSKAMKDINVTFVQAMVEARLEYKETGSISSRFAVAGEQDLGMVVCSQVKDDYRTSGKDPDSWLSCIAIEERIKSLLSKDIFNMLQDAAIKGNLVIKDIIEEFQCNLCDRGVCFGDGPRWHFTIVDEVLVPFVCRISSLSH